MGGSPRFGETLSHGIGQEGVQLGRRGAARYVRRQGPPQAAHLARQHARRVLARHREAPAVLVAALDSARAQFAHHLRRLAGYIY